jgi:hypothetical protein
VNAFVVFLLAFSLLCLVAAVWAVLDRNFMRRALCDVSFQNSVLKERETRVAAILQAHDRQERDEEVRHAFRCGAVRLLDDENRDLFEVDFRAVGHGAVLGDAFDIDAASIRSRSPRASVRTGLFDAHGGLIGRLQLELFRGSYLVKTGTDPELKVTSDGQLHGVDR